ncbi:hypothetical protein HYU95_03630 [Candidatus Daviesbacteria bacterium]|nr:hypothetical protein [Candidatus Daviesbacteria bacterium]
MAEFNPELPEKRSSLKKKAALTVAAAGTAAIGFLGVDRGAGSISAAGETPTTTPTRTATLTPTLTPTVTFTPTSTPDVKDREIAAMQTVITEAEKNRKKDEILAGMKATATALAVTPTNTPKPTETQKPTGTPKPPDTPVPIVTPNVQATQEATEKAVVKELADRKAAATARAEATVIAKAPPRPSPTYAVTTESGGSNTSEIPWEPIGKVTVGLAVLGTLVVFRRQIGNGIRRLAGLPGRGINWVRNWLSGKGAETGAGGDTGQDAGGAGAGDGAVPDEPP